MKIPRLRYWPVLGAAWLLLAGAASAGEVKSYRGIRPDDPHGRMALANPERGWRTEIYAGEYGDAGMHGMVSRQGRRFGAWDGRFRNYLWQDELDSLRYHGVTVVQGYIYLTGYPDTDLPPEKLADVKKFLDAVREYGAKVLLRFAYETDMNRSSGGPDGAAILRHLEQLAPVLRENSDVIHAFQAGFIGAWGEWHSSARELERDLAFRQELLSAMLEVMPPDRMIMVRVPKYKREMLAMLAGTPEVAPVTRETAFSDAPCARIGHFNDGFLANRDCGSTFPDPPYSNPGNPDFDRVAQEGAFVPVDGELFWADEGGTVDPLKAAVRMRDHHYNTFSLVHSNNGMFEQGLWDSDLAKPQSRSIDYWLDTPVDVAALQVAKMPLSDGYFSDRDGDPVRRSYFEYIRDHLGYRLELLRSEFPDEVREGAPFAVSMELVNRGFSIPVNPRPALLVLIAEGGAVCELPLAPDIREWLPRQPGEAETPVYRLTWTGTADVAPGRYRVGLWLPDGRESLRFRADYAIRCANADVPWEYRSDGTGGYNILGGVTVTPEP